MQARRLLHYRKDFSVLNSLGESSIFEGEAVLSSVLGPLSRVLEHQSASSVDCERVGSSWI